MTKEAEELRGRIVALETLVLTLMAHTAALTEDPKRFSAQVMKNAGEILARFHADVPDEGKGVASFALSSFTHLAIQVTAHTRLYSSPEGTA